MDLHVSGAGVGSGPRSKLIISPILQDDYRFVSRIIRLNESYASMLIVTCLRFFSVDYNGVVPEKFDVVKLSHLVDAEYGNQGLDFKLLNREGFAWTNCEWGSEQERSIGTCLLTLRVCPTASFQIGLHFLTTGMRRAVATLTSVSDQWVPASSTTSLTYLFLLSQPDVYFRLSGRKDSNMDPLEAAMGRVKLNKLNTKD